MDINKDSKQICDDVETEIERARNLFLANISHQIRTPLNAIVGMAEIAKAEECDKHKLDECMEAILTSSQTLVNIIEDLFDAGQVSSGNIMIKAIPCDLLKLLESMLGDTYSLHFRSGQKFYKDIKLTQTKVVCDGNRLQRVLYNVLGNATKFTPDDGEIHFSVWDELVDDKHAKYYFVIEDNGKGISEQDLQHVFEPFYRDKESVENYLEGTGLGLSVVKEILDAMRATISIQSELGVGTRVEISGVMEIVDEAATDSAQTTDESTLLEGRRVMVVEDQPINLMVARRMLERYGAVVDVAENGKVAYDTFMSHEEGSYDILFMDIHMPVMNGYEAAKNIRQSGRTDSESVKIVSMTADVFAKDIANAKEAGMDAHIGKPIKGEDLVATIKELLNL